MDRAEICLKIGASIRKYRLSADISQENLSMSAGLHPAYIGRLERGEKCPTVDTLYKISEALNIALIDLIRDDEDELTSYEAMKTITKSLERIPAEKHADVVKIIEGIADILD